MSRLETECLAKVPITESAIQVIFELRDATSSNRDVLSTWLKNVCLSHERLRAELNGSEILRRDDMNEVASVLMMLDELAELWGDEGKFRACRDRLRNLVPKTSELAAGAAL